MFIRIFLALFACAPLVALAQNAPPVPTVSSAPVSAPDAPPAASGSAQASPAAPMPPSGGTGISQEDRQKLMAAHQKALQDPGVQAATVKANAAQETLRAAMIADDKSLGPILDKLKNGGNTPGGAGSLLTVDERQKIMAERQKLEGSPEAKSMMDAVVAYRAAMRHALELADPTLIPLLDRIDAAAHASAGAPAASKP